MEQDLTKFPATTGEEITISFSDPASVAYVVVNGKQTTKPAGPIVVTPPAAGEGISKLDVAVDPAGRSGPVEVQVQRGSRTFRHFILPDRDLARLRFVYEEAEQRLVYCAVEDEYVIAGKNGKCPRHP
jgi:hypothetical protein